TASPEGLTKIRCSAELHGDGVGGLEADAPDVAGRPIGVLAHNLDSIGTIGLENPYRSRRAYRGCAEIPRFPAPPSAQPSTVSKYMIRRRGPPSQTCRTFLRNHAEAIAAIDLCVVPTVTFERLFAFL